MTQRRSAPVPGRSNVKTRISLGKQGRVRAVGACCARGRARSTVVYPASLAVMSADAVARLENVRAIAGIQRLCVPDRLHKRPK